MCHIEEAPSSWEGIGLEGEGSDEGGKLKSSGGGSGVHGRGVKFADIRVRQLEGVKKLTEERTCHWASDVQYLLLRKNAS